MFSLLRMNEEIQTVVGCTSGTGLWSRPDDDHCDDKVDEIRILISEFFKEDNYETR